ncbi:MAG: hypothetical protein HZC49_03325 [Nitrospirae bacterium]|nr:hypothetical protein [Nitrospirota bacterium]
MTNRTLLVMEGVVLLCIIFFIVPFSLSYADPDPGRSAVRSDEISPEGSGPLIRAIEVRGITRIEDEELIDLINLSAGEGLDRQELSRGIRRAFLKGIFQDIKAVTEPYGDGVKLIYYVKEIPLVDKIVIEGGRNIMEKTVRQKYYFKEGEDFKEEYLDAARLALYEFFRRKGYPDAEIQIKVVPSDKPSQVDIYINIEEGRPLIIEEIDIVDDVRYLMRVREGSILDADELDKDMKRIEEHYKKMNYIKPFKNNVAFTAGKLQKEVSFIESEEITDEAIAETADSIKRFYVSNGYYGAQVAAGVEREDDVIRITFIIFEGEAAVLRKISFSGTSINTEGIKKILPFNENKTFNNNLLDESRGSIIRFYNALGYLQADVTEIKKDFQNNGRDLNLEYVINEGARTIIKSVDIAGNKHIDELQVRNALNLEEGAPYNVIDIGDARRRALSLYTRYGYLDATVDVESKIDRGNAFLSFNIAENKPSIIGKIILKGNQKTRAKIIMREFTLKEGEPYNYEEISRTKQRLYKLGIFSEVTIDALEGGMETNNEIVKDMLVTLKEGKSGSVEVSLGYGDYEHVRGTLEINYRNLSGLNRQVGFRTDLNEVERRYIFNFREPWLFNLPNVPLKIYLIREEKKGLNIDTREVLYKIEKQSFITGIEKEIAEGLKVGLDYEYSGNSASAVCPLPYILINGTTLSTLLPGPSMG